MTRTILFAASIVAHVALAIGLGEIHVEKARAATAIEIAEVKKKAEKAPEPPKIEATPPKPAENSPPRQRRAAAPAPEAPPPEARPAEQAFNDLPDFGLALGGEGGGGVAVPQGRGPVAAQASPRPAKQLSAPAPAVARDECTEPAGKPKPVSVPQPAYSEAARAAGIEGKVRVQLTVDEQGNVVDVKVLQGLGYGLDEAALAAARSARFEPALRCGKPARATFNISMRFAAG